MRGNYRYIRLECLVAGLAVLIFGARGESAAPNRAEQSRVKALPELRSYTTHRVQMPTTAGEGLSFTVPLEGELRTIELQPFSLRSRDFSVLVQGADGLLRNHAAPPAATYRGEVAGVPGSRVVAAVAGGKVSARIEADGGEVWHVEPMSRFGDTTADASDHAVFRDEDLIPRHGTCGTRAEVATRSAFEDFAAGALGGTAATSMKVCDIAFDADFEFFQANGSSVNNTVRDIEDILNRVALLYEEQLSITFELTTIIVRTAEPDPYTSTNHDTLLEQMRSEWNLNRTNIHRDIAHLMTGKEILGSVIGSTFTGSMCETCNSARGYGFSQSQFSQSMAMRTCLTAHELGHSFGAPHCDGDSDCYIMCSVLNECAHSCTEFGSRAKAAIALEVASASCLTTLAPPLSLPFCDTFDLAVDDTKWPFNAVASVATNSTNPPSPPAALFLNNCCTPCSGQANTAPDEIRGNIILLGRSSTATLSYHTEHTGGAGTAGSRLFVEYESDLGEWLALNTLVASGTAQTSYMFWSHALPADALHDGFRLRFRLERTAGQANWFIDDVAIQDVELAFPVVYVRADALPGGNGSSWATAYYDLQDGLNAAACSRGIVEEIWVAAGTYRPDRGGADRGESFRLVSGVALVGGFAGTETQRSQQDPATHVTILSGDIGTAGVITDNSFHVVRAANAGEGTEIDGFTIMGGQANGSAPDDGGGGLLNEGSSLSVRNCTFHSNGARNGGGMQNTLGAATVVENSLFRENAATSAGGAMQQSVGSTVFVMQSRFLKNTATAGGALFTVSSEITVSDSLFSGNHATSGGAIQNFGSAAILDHCTISANSAPQFGCGGIVNLSSVNPLQSCILWGNTDTRGAVEASQVNGDAPSASYTCIQGWTGTFGGIGNSGSNPLFIDIDGPDNIAGTADDNPRLSSGSSSIDSGVPDFFPEPGATDLDGRPRVLCGRVDRGAFEFGIGDFDCDRSVDLGDYAHWDDCMTGPDEGPNTPACGLFDFNDDDDVDLQDFAGFQRTFAGP